MLGLRSSLLAVLPLALAACGSANAPAAPAEVSAGPASASANASVAPPGADVDQARCEARWAEVMALPDEPGAPAFDAHRAETLGRVRG